MAREETCIETRDEDDAKKEMKTKHAEIESKIRKKYINRRDRKNNTETDKTRIVTDTIHKDIHM